MVRDLALLAEAPTMPYAARIHDSGQAIRSAPKLPSLRPGSAVSHTRSRIWPTLTTPARRQGQAINYREFVSAVQELGAMEAAGEADRAAMSVLAGALRHTVTE